MITIAKLNGSIKIEIKRIKEMSKYISFQKTCAVFGCSKSTLNRWSRKGMLKKYRFNQKTFFKISEVELTRQALLHFLKGDKI